MTESRHLRPAAARERAHPGPIRERSFGANVAAAAESLRANLRERRLGARARAGGGADQIGHVRLDLRLHRVVDRLEHRGYGAADVPFLIGSPLVRTYESSASRISSAVWKRSAGSLASARMTMAARRGSTVSVSRGNLRVDEGVQDGERLPRNSRRPLSASHNMIPRTKRSERRSAFPWVCSGAI